MLPHPLSRSAPGANNDPPLPQPDLALLLEQHISAGFPPDLALDLVLNELVVRAADATHANAAALALLRNEEMVCRAATGVHAPELGIPLDSRDGLSGACVRTRTAQLSADTESDPRVDPSISRRLGIRSILMVPVFDHETMGVDQPQPLTGVLEVFSPFPNTFTPQTQKLLADFADECARICRVATHANARQPAEISPPDEEGIQSKEEDGSADDAARVSEAELIPGSTNEQYPPPSPAHPRQPYEVWTLMLAGLVILAAAAFSFMIGSRIGWLRTSQPPATFSPQSGPGADSPASGLSASSAGPAAVSAGAHDKDSGKAVSPNKPSSRSKPATSPSADELVVYDKDKVVFRLKPAPVGGQAPSAATGGSTPAPSPSPKTYPVPATRNGSDSIWLAPEQAESRLLSRVEPQYPADALADHRSGSVMLEVHVAEDGTVSSVRTLNGDPLLAVAAARAVRNWRYQPYREKDQPAKFQTDVTLTFSLPN